MISFIFFCGLNTQYPQEEALLFDDDSDATQVEVTVVENEIVPRLQTQLTCALNAWTRLMTIWKCPKFYLDLGDVTRWSHPLKKSVYNEKHGVSFGVCLVGVHCVS